MSARTVTESTPEGTEVELTDDSGAKVVTKTRSKAWRLRVTEDLVVMVDGKSGAYLANRLGIV